MPATVHPEVLVYRRLSKRRNRDSLPSRWQTEKRHLRDRVSRKSLRIQGSVAILDDKINRENDLSGKEAEEWNQDRSAILKERFALGTPWLLRRNADGRRCSASTNVATSASEISSVFATARGSKPVVFGTESASAGFSGNEHCNPKTC